MNRRSFLYYTCAVGTISVAGTLTRCSSDDPSDENGNGGGNNTPRLTVNLDNELTTVGSSKTQNNVIIVRKTEGNTAAAFVALTSICTHEACTVGYQSAQNQFVCPCHGSTYNINGGVEVGPAMRALTQYTVSVNNNILTVR